MFHHIGDGVDYPALVVAVSVTVIESSIQYRPESLLTADLKELEDGAELQFRAQLTVFRPRAIEWPWAVESTLPGGYTHQMKGDK